MTPALLLALNLNATTSKKCTILQDYFIFFRVVPVSGTHIEIYLRYFQIVTDNPLVYSLSVLACIELKPVHFKGESEDGGLDSFDIFCGTLV